MHDPMTVAFDIPNPFVWRRRCNGQWRPETLATIWHVDPEKDGTDDSCGWFMRARHGDPATLDKIAKAFEFEWLHGVPKGWFDENGDPNYSPTAITLGMFRIAANHVFGHWSGRADRFLRRNIFDILHFAENNCDSLYCFITQHYGKDKRDTVESRAREAAQIVYPWILREIRPRWKHPRWHVWHWKIQVHPVQHFKRWLFSRCAHCGKGFPWGYAPISGSWDSLGPMWFRSEPRVFHHECDGSRVPGKD